MSRIRGIEVKVQKEVLQTRKYGLNEILKQKTEEQSSDSKDDVEKKQMAELAGALPALDALFEVHRKIGEGTFSSVYLGSLRRQSALPPSRRRWFAIKHLVPTAHPQRVHHELRCLMDMGGKHNVIGVDLCLRHLDTIVFIMPYIPHKKFSEYVGSMDAAEVRGYMRALLQALRHVHSFGVIHRDVKPSNFLYDRDNRRYLLVDFGLAQRLSPAPPAAAPAPPAAAPALPVVASSPPPAHAATRKRLREGSGSTPEAKRAALDLSVSSRTRAAASPPAPPPPAPAPAPLAPSLHRATIKAHTSKRWGGARVVCACGGAGCALCACACAARAALCAACAARPAARAPRAGTQGYRPPEVLLKVGAQGVGVDVWAAGVVLGAALTARYPLLRAPDDASALAELADLLGTRALRQAAASMGRRVVTSGWRRGVCLRRLAARLRGAPAPAPAPTAPACASCALGAASCICRDDAVDPEQIREGASVAGFPDAAFALLARLLQPDPARRLSAAEALQHPFLAEP